MKKLIVLCMLLVSVAQAMDIEMESVKDDDAQEASTRWKRVIISVYPSGRMEVETRPISSPKQRESSQRKAPPKKVTPSRSTWALVLEALANGFVFP